MHLQGTGAVCGAAAQSGRGAGAAAAAGGARPGSRAGPGHLGPAQAPRAQRGLPGLPQRDLRWHQLRRPAGMYIELMSNIWKVIGQSGFSKGQGGCFVESTAGADCFLDAACAGDFVECIMEGDARVTCALWYADEARRRACSGCTGGEKSGAEGSLPDKHSALVSFWKRRRCR